MTKYNGTVGMLINDTVDVKEEIKQLKKSARVAEKMRNLFDQQAAIMEDQADLNNQQIALLKEQKKVIAKLVKIK